MILQDLMVAIEQIGAENNLSEGMAVPKKRRSKAKGKTRLSNWKRKGKTAATKAYNAAKTFFAKEKKAAASIKNEEKIIEEPVINSSDETIDVSVED